VALVFARVFAALFSPRRFAERAISFFLLCRERLLLVLFFLRAFKNAVLSHRPLQGNSSAPPFKA